MHSGSLVQVALQAERIRLRRMVRRVVQRSILAAAGLFFSGATFVFLEVAGYCWLQGRMTAPQAALICAGANLLAVLASLVLTTVSRRDSVAQEARVIRDDAWGRLMGSMAIGALLRPLDRRLGGKSMLGMTAAAVASTFLGVGSKFARARNQTTTKDAK